jgi:hypothetical protein
MINISAAAAKAREKAREDADPNSTETGVEGTRRAPVTLDAANEATLSTFMQQQIQAGKHQQFRETVFQHLSGCPTRVAVGVAILQACKKFGLSHEEIVAMHIPGAGHYQTRIATSKEAQAEAIS